MMLRALFAVLLAATVLVALPAPAPAAASCSDSLQSLINATPAGGTLSLPACTWRETIKVSRPIVIDGHSTAELRGSDVWTEWVGDGPWYSRQRIPKMAVKQIDPVYGTPTCADGSHSTCNQPEQLWLDGVWFRRALGAPRPGHREFGVTPQRRVILADNPAGHTVEVATRIRWLDLSSALNVTIRGLTFRHTAGSYQDDAIVTSGSRGVTFDRVSMFDAAYTALHVGGSRNLRILDAEISWNGGAGVGDYGSTGFRWEKGQVRENNRRGWDYWRGWSASGVKLYRATDAVLANLLVTGNGGPGLWADNASINITMRSNTVSGNLYHGLEYEGGPGPFVIESNSVNNNVECGIMVALNDYASTARGSVTGNGGSDNGQGICRGYNGNESQPGVTYSRNAL